MTTNTIRNFEIWVETKKKFESTWKKKRKSSNRNRWPFEQLEAGWSDRPKSAGNVTCLQKRFHHFICFYFVFHFGRKMSSDLQDIVRRVVENLSNIQPANSAATSSSEGCQNFTNETEVQELNRCFQVPRLPAPNSSVLQQSSGRDLAAGFSSRQNYSSARQPRMRRQVPRSSSGRFQPYARNCSRGGNRDVVEPPSYFKDVCVLPNPSWERVPRGKMKVFCINKNMYVDACEVKKDWDEVTLSGEIRKLLASILKAPN